MSTPFANIPTTEYANRFVVRFRCHGGLIRYGQNRSATFDYSTFVLALRDAKVFASMEHARAWCRKNVPDILHFDFFEGFTIVNLEAALHDEATKTRGGS